MFIHTSSLIFDDLPWMDNALQSRGKDSLHLVYGEGMAILVAIGLLNASYELVFYNQNISIEKMLSVQAEIVESVGSNGMVGGQVVDLALAKQTDSSNGNWQNS